MELLLTESDDVITRIEIQFNQELKKQYLDCTEVKKSKIMDQEKL